MASARGSAPGRVLSNKLLIFPDIKFTCNGSVVNWIFSGAFVETPNSLFEFPELLIFDNRDDHYRLRKRTSYDNVQLPIVKEGSDRVRFTPITPLDFTRGEILGLLIRSNNYSDRSIRFRFLEDPDSATQYHYYITPSNPTLNDEGTYYKSSATLEQLLVPLITVQFSTVATLGIFIIIIRNIHKKLFVYFL